MSAANPELICHRFPRVEYVHPIYLNRRSGANFKLPPVLDVPFWLGRSYGQSRSIPLAYASIFAVVEHKGLLGYENGFDGICV